MPEQRRDPTTGAWSVLATERAARPLGFGATRTGPASAPVVQCPFCRGHEALTPPTLDEEPLAGCENEAWSARAFANKFPALRVEGELARHAEGPFDQVSGIGAHEVVVDTPHHDRPLWTEPARVAASLRLTARRLADLRKDTRLAAFSVFRNNGPRSGASQPHPHSQILASAELPLLHAQMAHRSSAYRQMRGRDLLADVVDHERTAGVRVIRDEGQVLTVSAYAPRVPFEVWIVPTHSGARLCEASPDTVQQVAQAWADVRAQLDAALGGPSVNTILYTSPRDHSTGWRWHLRLLPRVVGIGGFELGGGGGIVHTLPATAAEVLRAGGTV